ncbi:MAG: succinate dehydrogenase iron-sulfur subunit, partial [Sphingomonas sp.]
MAEFSLPKNSVVKKGVKHAPVTHGTSGGKRLKSFKVYRYDPDSGENPRY